MPAVRPDPEARRQRLVVWRLLGVGVIVVVLSVVLGKRFDLADFVYELGVAVFVLALVETLLLRAVNRVINGISSQAEAQLQRFLEQTRQLSEEMQKQTEEVEQHTRDVKLNDIVITVNGISEKLDSLQSFMFDQSLAKPAPPAGSAEQTADDSATGREPPQP